MMTDSSVRIFVHIPSYRDRECQWTVKDLFAKAQLPERVFVGICWQSFPDLDQDCFHVQARPDQVRAVHFHAKESKGLGWARQQAQKLWEGEEFVLQIDSHMRFIQDWDVCLLEMLAACDSPWPVLTVYPSEYTPPNELETRNRPYVQCIKKFTGCGVPMNTARPVPNEVPVRGPLPTASLAGGFLFGSSRIITDVPSDPKIFFFGEETNLAVRLWTHGFDLFSPHKDVVYHYYGRKESSRPWNDSNEFGPLEKSTYQRLRQLCQPDRVLPGVDLGIYGLGPARTLAEYERYAGVNFSSRTFAIYARNYPFVYSEEVVRQLVRESDIKVSTEAQLFIIDQHGFLYTKQRGSVIYLNPTAAYIWCALEDGITLASIEEQLVANGVGSAHEVEDQVTTLITHLQGEGAIAGTEDSFAARAGHDDPPPDSVDTRDLPQVGLITENYRLLSTQLRVRYQDARLRSQVHPFLANLTVDSLEPVTHDLLVYQDAKTNYRAIEQGVIVTETLKPELLALDVLSWMENLTLEALDPLFCISGGLVARNDQGIVVVESANRAKDILLAKLISRGYSYFSSTVVPVSRQSFRCHALPLGMHVTESDTSAIEADLIALEASSIRYDLAGDPPRRLIFPPAKRAGAEQEAEIRCILFVQRKKSGGIFVEPLDAAEGLRRLFGNFMFVHKPMSLEEVTWLVHKIEDVKLYSLHINDLDEAAEAVEALAL